MNREINVVRLIFILSIGLGILAGCGTSPAPNAIAHAGILTLGQPVQQSITGPAQEAHWLFAINQDTRIRLTYAPDNAAASVRLTAPDGLEIINFTPDTYASISTGDITLDQIGNYVVVISAPSQTLTNYTLLIIDIDAPQVVQVQSTATQMPPVTTNTTPTSSPPLVIPTDDRLAPQIAGSGSQLHSHEPIRGELRSQGGLERYSFFGPAGSEITLGATTVTGSNVTPRVTLYAPSGDIVAEVSQSFGSLDAVLTGFRLPATGAYVVFVRDVNGTGTGYYDLAFGFGATMRSIEQSAPPVDVVMTGFIGNVGVRDLWPLDLLSGDVISAVATVEDGVMLDPLIALLSEDGSVISFEDQRGDQTAALRSVTIPQGGRYYIAVSPSVSPALGSYTLLWQYQ